ncbi:MFS transporter [Frisingicoccus sp.]|uniref:MFS transporter n=1 Tax=Frisingicoccus sp. TaxID=1918627 RepID=UPI0015B8ACD1
MRNNQNFNLVLIGQIISLFGSAIQRFSISLYLLELTGSPAIYSAILALSMLPYIFLAPVAGMTADSFNRKKIMIFLDCLSGILLFGYSVCLALRLDSVLLAGGILILLASISAFYNPAVTACLPQIVPAKQLSYANSCISQVSSFSNILGPVLAGILYSFWDIRLIVLFNAASFLFSALLEGFIRLPNPQKSERTAFRLLASYLYMGTTWKKLRKNYIVTSGIILSYGLYNICIVPINSILFPTVMNLEFHVPSEVYGTVEGIITLGMLLSGILVACRPGWFHFSKIYLWNYPMPTVMVLMGLILLFPAGTYAGIAALALGGMTIMFCLGVGNIVTLTYMQNVIPSQMLGSVSALSTAVATGTVPIGQVLFGQLMESRLPSGCILLLSAFVAALVSWYVRKNIQRCKTFESK